MRAGARGIQSIEVSGRILRALVATSKPMMLKELAQAAELAPAQCHAYLTSLRSVGLVHQDATSGLYRTGPFALRLGIGWLNGTPLAVAAIRELRLLAEDLGIMSLLSVWGVSGPTIVQICAGSTRAALNLRPGTLFSVTGTATGRVFAAFSENEAVGAMAAQEFSQAGRRGGIGGLLTREDSETQLEATRSCGYAIAEAVPIPDTNAVAAPIFDNTGTLQFVATLIGPIEDLAVDPGAVAVRRLLAVTEGLSAGRGAPLSSGAAQKEA
ncbi:helix-turn-helix domain-containing protein [Salipiger sp. P9]|uniref:IclR family transcriptional regulator n=1 Tax=Salipiger pentaromativorans TaxID=2943193 RepID=UPI0021575B88|nr:helix-turn-helix domain-containing protein [Salipiger pentaromativorans]MCR8550613.1 helix-turn-helix domain-containing protein [Salipiger pentaromativorans]